MIDPNYKKMSDLVKDIILEEDKKKYPIGKLEFNVSGANPNTYLGFGTWILWGAGKVPVGVDTSDSNFNTVEKTGGEKTHKLTIDEMPSHSHSAIEYNNGGSNTGWAIYTQNVKNAWSTSHIGGTGGDQPHNNLQPYITCYMWKRTA